MTTKLINTRIDFLGVTTSIALIMGLYYNLIWVDALSGIASSVVIAKWSYNLIFQSGKKLLDYSHE